VNILARFKPLVSLTMCSNSRRLAHAGMPLVRSAVKAVCIGTPKACLSRPRTCSRCNVSRVAS
jgi:hypothetical protein